MKVIIVYPSSKDSVQLNDIRTPIPGKNEALFRTLKLGIDGTDRDINAGFYGAPPDDENFLVVGHEGLGVVFAKRSFLYYVSSAIFPFLAKNTCLNA
jgi:threonine dehydrogenase-like Zn-dependent dehydrogenase